MTIERAHEINGCMLDHGLLRFDLVEEKDLVPLTEYSLQEMLTATQMVKDANPKGAGTHTMVCDERLIAALYVAYHYPAANDPTSIDPIVQAKDGRMVIVVDQRCAKQERAA